MKRYYGAYGSNLNLGQMKVRCKGSRLVGSTSLEGYELLYKGSKSGSYLTVEKKEGSNVPLGIFEVTDEDERMLDIYEGYPSFYYKKSFKLDVNGELKEVFIYIMDEKRAFGLPSNRYVEICKEGYDDFGFDKAILDKAYERTKLELKGL